MLESLAIVFLGVRRGWLMDRIDVTRSPSNLMGS